MLQKQLKNTGFIYRMRPETPSVGGTERAFGLCEARFG